MEQVMQYSKQVIQYSKGNPGAMSFLMEVINGCNGNFEAAFTIMSKIERCTSIRGTNLWVLYSDLGNKDMNTVSEICKNVPDLILENACNCQDYSGRDLIKIYVE